MGPIWVLSAPDGPHVGPMNLAIGNGFVWFCLFWSYQPFSNDTREASTYISENHFNGTKKTSELIITGRLWDKSAGDRSLFVCSDSWWRHQMETFSMLLAICAGNSPVPGEFPTQRSVTRSFDVFFDMRLNRRLSKQSWGWWFETLSRPFWRQCNVISYMFTLDSSDAICDTGTHSQYRYDLSIITMASQWKR